MLRNKRAFTLAEMLITFFIMGVLAAMALMTVKPYEKTFKWLYVRIYHTLETAVYNSMMTRTAFPTTSTAFCDMLREYVNASEFNCTAGDLTRESTTFPEANIKLVASNGMRLWIASNGGQAYTHTEVIDGNTSEMKYFVVFADINGSKSPNSTLWVDAGKLADIVAFVVTEASVVIPIGPPEIDTRYMYATAIYPPDDENQPEGTRSNPMSYYAAKNDAWGASKSMAEPMSLDFRRDFPTNSPFYVDYPAANSVNTAAGCTATNNTVSPCYVKVEDYN